jgi:hypothetical protein
MTKVGGFAASPYVGSMPRAESDGEPPRVRGVDDLARMTPWGIVT